MSVPTERQVAGGSVAARAAGYGFEGHRVDGNDVAAVYEATQAALQRAREGGGPTIIEAMTYRMGPHSTSDDPGRYRTLADEQAWTGDRDPIAVAARQLSTEDVAAAEEHAAGVVKEVREGLLALTPRPSDELFSFVYREPTEALLAQQRAWKESLDA
jgi:pyruvate dehydrogenase E1 component alpha subunit